MSGWAGLKGGAARLDQIPQCGVLRSRGGDSISQGVVLGTKSFVVSGLCLKLCLELLLEADHPWGNVFRRRRSGAKYGIDRTWLVHGEMIARRVEGSRKLSKRFW